MNVLRQMCGSTRSVFGANFDIVERFRN